MSEQLLEQIFGELQTLNHRVGNIETEQQFMKVEQQTIRSEQQSMKDEQQQIKQAVLETNETVKRIERVQEQQHRIIELLSMRSIEQEAMLKRIV